MSHSPFPSNTLSLAREVLQAEADAITQMARNLDDTFTQAVTAILQTQGRVIITGMGKSGHIACKIAATFASTGTPAFFVHPAEAAHGDLGMITAQDCVIALSNSGESNELLAILPALLRKKVCLISITSRPQSTLAQAANIHLNTHVTTEACPLGLAPTTSTTSALALADALAIVVLSAKGFSSTDFALSHPAGRLGRRLLVTVDEIMHSASAMPCVPHSASLQTALLEISQKGLGFTAIINDTHQLIGIFTDGDLRRLFNQNQDKQPDLTLPIASLMHPNPLSIRANELAVSALNLMEAKKINGLFVTNEHGVLVGALNMHDLLQAGVL
jgi:arabinose-5-phosphate isomerase